MFGAHRVIQLMAGLFAAIVLVMPVSGEAVPMMVPQVAHLHPRIAASPDGRLMATAGENTIKLWDARGRLLRTFEPVEGKAQNVEFSPDGKMIAGAYDEDFGKGTNSIRLYTLDGALIRQLNTENFVSDGMEISASASGFTFSADGQHIYETRHRFGGHGLLTSFHVADGSVEWRTELATDERLKEGVPVIDSLSAPSISPDSQEIAVGVGYGNNRLGIVYTTGIQGIQVWSTKGVLLRKYLSPKGSYSGVPQAIHWNEDGSISCMVEQEGFVRINKEFTQATSISGAEKDSMSVGPLGELVWTETVQIKPVTSTGKGKKKITPQNLAGNVAGDSILVISHEGIEKRINLSRTFGFGKVSSVKMFPDHRIALFNKSEWILEPSLTTAIRLGEPLGLISTVTVSPNGQFFATGLVEGAIDLWSRDGHRIRRLSMVNSVEGSSPIKAISFSEDGNLLVAANEERIRVWNRNGSLIREYLNVLPDNPYSHRYDPIWISAVYVDDGGKKIVLETSSSSDRGEVVAIGIDDKELFRSKLRPPYKVKMMPGRGVWINDNFRIQGFMDYGEIERSVVVAWDGSETEADKPEKHLPEEKHWDQLPFGTDFVLRHAYYSPIMTIEPTTAAAGKLPIHLVASATDWLAWSDDGIFDGSPGAARLVLQVDGFTPYTIDQFALRDNRPDLLLARLGVSDMAAQQHFKALWQRRLSKAGISESQLQAGLQVPTVQIQSAKREGEMLVVQAKVNAASAPLARYNVYVNGVPIFGSVSKPISGKEALIEERVALVPGSNQVEISALDQAGAESFRALHTEVMEGTRKGDLWVMAFGVSRYEDPALQLEWANKDALDLGSVLKRLEGKGYNNVHTNVLTDAQVTPAALRSAKTFLANAKPEDTLVVFIAGHGVHDRDAAATYYFLPAGAKVDDIAGTAVTFETVEDLLQGVGPRQKLFLMDTCESGDADEGAAPTLMADAKSRGLAARAIKRVGTNAAASAAAPQRSYLWQRDRYIYNDLVRRSGAIVFSSSRGGEYSYERSDIKHGVFTFAVLEALQKTSADSNADGQVSTDELRSFVAKKVSDETSDKQNPTVDRDNAYARFGFPLAGK